MLCLEANSAATGEGGTILPFETVGPVVGVELHSRLGGVDFHVAPALGFNDFNGETELAGISLVEYEAVVVASTVFYLDVIGVVDAFADDVRLGKVERCALYAEDFACRNGCLIDGDEMVGVNVTDNVHCTGCGVGDAR